MNTLASSHPMSRYSTGRIALVVTLGTESIFFLTLLVAYAALRGDAGWAMTHSLARLAIPIANSAVLLASAAAAWRAVRAIERDRVQELQTWLLAALLLGLVFVAAQVFEYRHAGLQIDDQAFGGVFFTLMGFHALHVLAGVVFLALNLLRARLGDFRAGDHEPVLLGSWFWYYVTAVWVVLFAALYLL